MIRCSPIFNTLFLNKQTILPPRADLRASLDDSARGKPEKVNTLCSITEITSMRPYSRVSLKQWLWAPVKTFFLLFKSPAQMSRYESGDKEPLSTGSPHQHGIRRAAPTGRSHFGCLICICNSSVTQSKQQTRLHLIGVLFEASHPVPLPTRKMDRSDQSHGRPVR